MSEFAQPVRTRLRMAKMLVWVIAMAGSLTLVTSVAAPQIAHAGTFSYTLMNSAPTSPNPGWASAGNAGLELGVNASTSVAGSITAVRFYKLAGAVDSHTANIWDSTGVNLASQLFTNETADGWQEVQLTTPVSISAGTTFTVSIFSPNNFYTNELFPTLKVGPLSVLRSVYNYTASSAFPNTSNGANTVGSNYGIDFVFTVNMTDVNCGTSGTFQIVANSVVGNTSCVGSIVIPEGVTSISPSAFYGTSGITSVTFPSTLTTIGDGAFMYSSLNALNFSSSSALTTIANAFANTQLVSVVVPNGVTTIADGAFNGISTLTSLSLPTSLRTIGRQSFGSSHLSSVVIPEGVTFIGDTSFYNDAFMTSVSLPSTLTTIDASAFAFDSLVSVVIPDAVTSIGASAFDYMPTLQSVTYCGNSLSVANYPYRGNSGVGVSILTPVCTHPHISLSSASIEGSANVAIAPVTLINTGGAITNVSISPSLPTGLTIDTSTGTISGTPSSFSASSAYTVTATGSDSSTATAQLQVTIHTEIVSCSGGGAFAIDGTHVIWDGSHSHACAGSITIPAYVTHIDPNSFDYAHSLTSVGFAPQSMLTNIGQEAFYNDYGLTSVALPEGLLVIAQNAFGTDDHIPTLVIPSTVTSIGHVALSYMNALSSITLPSGLTTFDGTPFNGTPLTSINYCGSLPAVGTYFATYFSSINIRSTCSIAQVVAFTSSSPTSSVVGGTNYVPTASGGASGNPVVIATSTPSICTLNSGSVNFVGAGTCTLTVNQASSGIYLAATEVVQSFSVGKGTQNPIALTSTSGTQGTLLALTASGGSGVGILSYVVTSVGTANCSISSGSSLSATTVGTCTVTATKASDTNYLSASSSATTVYFVIDPAVLAAQRADAAAQAAQAAQAAADAKAAADKAAADALAAAEAQAAADKAAADAKLAADAQAAADKAAADAKAAADKALADKVSADAKAAADKAAADAKAAADKAAADKRAADAKAAAAKIIAETKAKIVLEEKAKAATAAQPNADTVATTNPIPTPSPATPKMVVKTSAIKTGKKTANIKLAGLKKGAKIKIVIKRGVKR